MEFLTEGTFVNIKRTDGRVHSAMVAKVNPDCRSVTVEWSEKGETKGKEIELSAIMQLNSELFNAAPEPEPKKQATAAANLVRNPTQANIRNNIGAARGKENAQNHRLTVNHMNNGTAADPPPLINPTVAKLKAPAPRISTNNNAQPPAITGGGTMTNATPANNGGARYSGVVKEVKKMEKNREERRARQAEVREEKMALMNMDPGNPNWELAAMIREFTSSIDFRPLCDGQAVEDHQITVCVRKRPLNKKEAAKKELDVISVATKDQMIVHEPKSKVDLTKFLENHKFRFDYAFDDKCNNELVYKYTAKPLVQTIFEGGMATCFAYGQTGSGKTHTMGGEFTGKLQDCKSGIYGMATRDVFALLKSPKYAHLKLVVSASFFEIYSGKVFDLLSNKERLRILEDGKQQVQVVGLTEKVVDTVEQVLKLIQTGNAARTAGQTAANQNSSRSHAVFQIVLRPPGTGKVHGKFSLIDLAGNERGADTNSANRQVRMEGAEINKSLLALKECIRALGKQSAHLPFRVSKLTHVLRDSFIGENSKTCMIAMISPGLSSCEHTLNTLRYANRVKELVVNDLSPTEGEEELEVMEEDYVNEEQQMNAANGSGRGGGGGGGKRNGQANDFAQLRSLSDHDMSVEMFNQHAAISELQQTEELVHEQHKAVIEFLNAHSPQIVELYRMTNNVEYDQDAYCRRGEVIFNKLSELVDSCKELMTDLRTKLADEELLSNNIVRPGKR